MAQLYCYKMMKIKTPILILLILLCSSACDRGFESLNTDPANPSETTVDRLFAGYLSLTFWNYDYWANNAKNGWMIWTQQVSSTNNRGLSAFRQSDQGRDNMWSFLYKDIFQTYRAIEQEMNNQAPETQARSRYKMAAARILLYFYAAKVSDLYGDIPFTEAGLGLAADNPVLRPRFDSQESLYLALLEDLRSIDALYATEGPEQFDFQNTEDEIDIYYFNDWSKWRRFANSLRLRLAMRLTKVRPDLAEQHAKEILGNGLPLIESAADHAEWTKATPGYESVGLNDAHRFDEAQGIKSRASRRLWDQLANGVNDADIFDIRARIFYAKNAFNQWAPIPSSPQAQEEQNIQPDPLFDPDIPAQYSILTPRFMGGRNTRERHFLSSETAFLRAEAIWRGWVEGDARAAYEEGIRRSVDWYVRAWNEVAPSNVQLEMPSEEELQALLNGPKVQWDDARGLELILTQKWVDFMLDPLEAYSEWRRTGFPVLEEAISVTGAPMTPPRRFVFPQSEAIDNAANYQEAVSRMGGDEADGRVWWDGG